MANANFWIFGISHPSFPDILKESMFDNLFDVIYKRFLQEFSAKLPMSIYTKKKIERFISMKPFSVTKQK